MPTTRARRLISLLSRSIGLVDQILVQWLRGKRGEGQHFGFRVVHQWADLGEGGWPAGHGPRPRPATGSASGWANTVRNTAATMSLWDLGTRASRLRAKWTLCRRRHKVHYADLRIMPMSSLDSLAGQGFRAGEVGIIRAASSQASRLSGGLVSAGASCAVAGFGRVLVLLEGEVGVEVDLGGLDALVAEPEGDDAGVDAGVEESHRGGVAQHVCGDRLAVQDAQRSAAGVA